MKIFIVCGSHREESQSGKVARHIRDELARLEMEPHLLDLAGNPLPLWEEKIWDGDPQWTERIKPISEELAASDGLVVVSPEWNGMVPAGLKNFFLLWTRGELAHKPALIVTLSSVDGGAYPVAELRMSSYKNNRLCYLPEHLIIRNVGTVLNPDPADNNAEADGYFRERITWCLTILREYARAFRQIRASGVGHNETFKNGM